MNQLNKEVRKAIKLLKIISESEHAVIGCDDIDEVIESLKDALAQQEKPEHVMFAWNEGYPKSFYAEEWFIAKTIYGDKVVLKALPEEYTYDFTTADSGELSYAVNGNAWFCHEDLEFVAEPTKSSIRYAIRTES